MKQKLLLFAASCFLAASSFATVHTITVGPGSGFTFSPDTMPGVTVGDTIMWVWSSGSHTTTSTSVPPTAIGWDQPISSTSTSFSYKAIVAGTYNYKCTPHASMGMTGSFVVSPATSVDPLSATTNLFGMFPNPAKNGLHLSFNSSSPAEVTLTDITGRKIKAAEYNNVKTADFSLDGISSGLYMVSVSQDGVTRQQKLTVN